MDQVFNIPELAEAILFELPVRDLLVNAQRVNRGWRTTITQSPILQQVLFLAPAPTDSEKILTSTELSDKIDRELKDQFRSKHCAHNYQHSCTYFKNPSASRICYNLTVNNPQHMLPEASWRRMFVHQPPEPLTLCRSADDDGRAWFQWVADDWLDDCGDRWRMTVRPEAPKFHEVELKMRGRAMDYWGTSWGTLTFGEVN